MLLKTAGSLPEHHTAMPTDSMSVRPPAVFPPWTLDKMWYRGQRVLIRRWVRCRRPGMTRVTNTITIYAPDDVIWPATSDFGVACQYLGMVINCTVDGAWGGALRTLTNTDGSTIVERLEMLNGAACRSRYAVLWYTREPRVPQYGPCAIRAGSKPPSSAVLRLQSSAIGQLPRSSILHQLSRQHHCRGRISPQQTPNLHRNRTGIEAALGILCPANAACGDERQAQAQVGDGAQCVERKRKCSGTCRRAIDQGAAKKPAQTASPQSAPGYRLPEHPLRRWRRS